MKVDLLVLLSRWKLWMLKFLIMCSECGMVWLFMVYMIMCIDLGISEMKF